ncbi:pseudaminic acid cytidylyltransferase, partial [Candidatus Pelagibacter bacterium]|nr:pseudaminic acid cytidylyltransferase [Candidatus Pelagibacter bacterium]
MTICIIPARSGSKRIKNKNIKKIQGEPIIAKVIQIAKKSGLFKRVIVSTDSLKIAEISRKFGAEVPFLRSKKLSDDFTPTYKVLADCIKKIKSQNEEYHFCIYPTSILINKQDLTKAFSKIKRQNANFICPVSKFENNPLRSLKINKKFINFTWPKFQTSRSQDLQELYYDTGSFYIYKTSSLLKITKT